MENNTFTRVFELETVNKQLTLYQQQVGEVNCVVWDAALVLAKYLDTLCDSSRYGIDWLRGKKILELGAGIGCVGMTAACLGGKVIMTDLKCAFPILEKNILLNKNQWRDSEGTAESKILEWGNIIDFDYQPDIILLADCVYYKESIQPLIETLEYFCENNRSTYAILSQEQRDTPGQIPVWKEFLNELSKKFELEYVPQSEQHPIYSSKDIFLIKLNII
ncbi:hypothetical protein PV328_008841 [Microctonus aethiopoides]|uniref:Uncharacterized protein n=1 Tax=Microctonus aethiopoides TaxID=144406 RepID=A0AA39FKP7_9HYME|nr:hypothetical protein PV328_008841 [Microctonus aethiopoides]